MIIHCRRAPNPNDVVVVPFDFPVLEVLLLRVLVDRRIGSSQEDSFLVVSGLLEGDSNQIGTHLDSHLNVNGREGIRLDLNGVTEIKLRRLVLVSKGK